MTEGPASKEEIEITPAMIQAGREALWDFSIDYQGEEVVQVVYREMAILDESRAPRFIYQIHASGDKKVTGLFGTDAERYGRVFE